MERRGEERREERETYEDADGADEQHAKEGAPVAVPRERRVLRPRVRLARAHAVQEAQRDEHEAEEREQLQHEAREEDLGQLSAGVQRSLLSRK